MHQGQTCEGQTSAGPGPTLPAEPAMLEVVIEIPRGSFLKRGSTGHRIPSRRFPRVGFNYGSVPKYLGGEGRLA